MAKGIGQHASQSRNLPQIALRPMPTASHVVSKFLLQFFDYIGRYILIDSEFELRRVKHMLRRVGHLLLREQSQFGSVPDALQSRHSL